MLNSSSFTFPPPPPPPPRIPSYNGQEETSPQNGGRSNGRGGFWRGQIRGRGRGRGTNQGHRGGSSLNNSHYTHNRGASGSSGVFSHALHKRPQDQAAASNFSQKRNHETAFSESPNTNTRPKAAPAVPSFNTGLPELLAPNVLHLTQSKESPKKKKHNLLGLTPSLDDHDLSSDDEGEELRLSRGVHTTGYRFEYRGQTSTLKTASEIAAWIAERKKRYPTASRIEAAKKEAAERRKKLDEDRKARVHKPPVQEVKRESRVSAKGYQPERKHGRRVDDFDVAKSDSTSPLEARTEALRRKAEKAAKQLARVERALKRVESKHETLGKSRTTVAVSEKSHSGSNLTASTEYSRAKQNNTLVTPTRNEVSPKAAPFYVSPEKSLALTEAATGDDISEFNSEGTDDSQSELTLSDSESTSSSGSESSEEQSDSAPEELTSIQTKPMRVPPPKRTAFKKPDTPQVCTRFLRVGKCKFGKHCRYLHERPGRAGRKGLWEVMVEREQEQEREHMLRVIMVLGQNGMLDGDLQDSSPLTSQQGNG